MMWTTHGTGRYFAGEADVIVRPSLHVEPKPVVMHIHGAEAGDGGADWMTMAWRVRIFKALAVAGYTTVSCDLGGSATWGNDTGQSRISSAYSYSQNLAGIEQGPAILFAQSMGGLGAFIWTKNNPSLVKGIVALIPVINLADLQTSNYQAAINAAYDGTYDDATMGTQRNPRRFPQQLAGTPIQLWYGTTDTLCKPEDAEFFGNESGAIMKPLAGGHTEETVGMIGLEEIIKFLGAL